MGVEWMCLECVGVFQRPLRKASNVSFVIRDPCALTTAAQSQRTACYAKKKKKVIMRWPSFEFLRAQNNFSSDKCTVEPRGEEGA